jgi:hypothetical protein
MPTDRLDKLVGVRAKINRAKHHLFQLHQTIEAWEAAEEEDHSPTFHYDEDQERLEIILHKVRADDINWPLIVGDAVHNLRSALDHLVFQLALLNGRSIEECNRTAFPICIAEANFIDARKRIDGFVHPKAVNLIEELQPYKAASSTGKGPRKSNLWIISTLDIVDKHRMLVIAGKYFQASSVSYSVNRGEPTGSGQR